MIHGTASKRVGLDHYEKLILAYVILSTIFVFSVPHKISAQTPAPQPPINLVPNAPEELGSVPSHLEWVRSGVLAMADPIDGTIVFISDQGTILGRRKVPAGFNLGTTISDSRAIRILDRSGATQIAIPRDIDPALDAQLASEPVTEPRSPLPLSRSTNQRLSIGSVGRSGRQLNIQSVSGGYLADALEIGRDSEGNRYVLANEIVSFSPQLAVRAHVLRYNRSGRLTGIARIPLSEMSIVPEHYASVDDGGILRVLIPTDARIILRTLPFFPADQRGRMAKGRSLDLEPSKTIDLPTHLIERDHNELMPDRGRMKPQTPPLSRTKILQNGEAFLKINWTMTARNYSHADIDDQCAKETKHYWKRPRHFTSDYVGKVIGPMPYFWGGADTPEQFLRKLSGGSLAGNICTCREQQYNYCWVADAAGVDCSGFVSRAWGLEKLGTTQLYLVSKPVTRLSDLRPGDAFNRAGSHVRLIKAVELGPPLRFWIVESTTASNCEGVCENVYGADKLNGYAGIRYVNLQDEPM